MVSGFIICGTSSLPREDDDYERRQTRSADSSPRKSRSRSNNKNPYSNRGLDKFSALLEEIEQKRQQIYSQINADEISLVRFVYSGDHDFKPIVVKVKNKPEIEKPKSEIIDQTLTLTQQNPSSLMAVREENKGENSSNSKKKKMGFYRKLRVYQWKEPRFYLPMIVIVILMFLVFFGRTFTIMCTSIGWYFIPTITDNTSSSNLRRYFKKKDYAMRSEGTASFKQQNGHRK